MTFSTPLPHPDAKHSRKDSNWFIKLYIFNDQAEILNYIDFHIIVAELYTVIKIYT